MSLRAGSARLLRPLCLLLALACAACQQEQWPTTRPVVLMTGLSGPTELKAVEAECVPPVGWVAQPLEVTSHHSQQIWVSPTGDTAYGVIHMHLPFPVGTGFVLWGFLNEMRQREGEAHVLKRRDDPTLPGLRFTVEGGVYRLRVNLMVRGSSAWAVYAGTRRDRPENPPELALAERAREATVVGREKGQ